MFTAQVLSAVDGLKAAVVDSNGGFTEGSPVYPGSPGASKKPEGGPTDEELSNVGGQCFSGSLLHLPSYG